MLFMASEAQKQKLIERNTKHGLSKIERGTYRSWKDARARCRNPNDSDYPRYGGRGVSFAAAWDDFATFFNEMGRRPDGMTLERVNRDGNYESGNCVWADKFTQANHRCNKHRLPWKKHSDPLRWTMDLRPGKSWPSRTLRNKPKCGKNVQLPGSTESLAMIL